MAKSPPSTRRDRIKPVVPKLVEYTDDLIYGDVWERPGLSKRDRSLVTVSALIAAYRPEQLTSHIQRALANGGGLGKASFGQSLGKALVSGTSCGAARFRLVSISRRAR